MIREKSREILNNAVGRIKENKWGLIVTLGVALGATVHGCQQEARSSNHEVVPQTKQYKLQEPTYQSNPSTQIEISH